MSKETQNKWEEINQKMIKNNWSEQAVFEIQEYLDEAYQRGKEEAVSDYQTDYEQIHISQAINTCRLQTLEEVEREIKENFNNQNSMTITYYDLLQTINKMKTK